MHLYFKRHNKIKGWTQIRKFEDKYANLLEIFGLYIYTVGYHKFRYRSLFKNKLVLGFYESSKYFDCISDVIRTEFEVEKSAIGKGMIEDICNHTAIAVGVRRGDFVTGSNKSFCDVCTAGYYEKGIEYIYKSLSDEERAKIKVYMFTDDVEWTKANIRCKLPVQYITSSVDGALKPWEMVHIISKCKYQVISNSSFFWWGQYLNNSEGKLVIAPNKWRNREEEIFEDIYQDNWICIDPR